MAIEEAAYTTVESDGAFEIRDYAPQVLAEILFDGDQEQAGNAAFSRLFEYISGANRSRAKLSMTAPVSQEPRREKIAMTTPVGQERTGGRWAVSFTMPAACTVDSLPAPGNPPATLRAVPARRLAAVHYSGTWSEQRYRSHLAKLESWIGRRGLAPVGGAVWARHSPPFMPWFLRRNEILIPVEKGAPTC
jgi:hypothetical protein